MLIFEHSYYLYLLFLLIPIILLYYSYLQWRKKAINRVGDSRLVTQLMKNYSPKRQNQQFGLFSLAYILLIIALANPQMGTKFEKVKQKGIDFIIALDISQSMMAEDLKPNRLERAKQFVGKLLDKLQGDRIGLIVFAGHAYLQVPLTTDYAAVKTTLKSIDTDFAPMQGTAIGEAIQLAGEAFNKEDKKFKALLIISDGEDHEEEAQSAAEDLAESGVKILTVGVGSQEGAEVPVFENGIRAGVKMDENGDVVMSKMNVAMLAEIADVGNGRSFQLSGDADEARLIIKELSGMEKKEFEDHVFSDYEDHFQWFLGLAIFILIIESFYLAFWTDGKMKSFFPRKKAE